jgi:hypothetical protein
MMTTPNGRERQPPVHTRPECPARTARGSAGRLDERGELGEHGRTDDGAPALGSGRSEMSGVGCASRFTRHSATISRTPSSFDSALLMSTGSSVGMRGSNTYAARHST